MRIHSLAIIAAAAALALSACSSAEDQTAAANEEVCSSLTGLVDSASTVITTASEAANGETSVTVEQVQEGTKALQQQWGELKQSLAELDSSVNWQATGAVDNFQDTINGIAGNDDLSATEAVQQMGAAKDTLVSDLNGISDQIGC